MSLDRLRDAFIEELKDAISFEEQLIKALPKMMKKASNQDLQAAFKDHLKETEEQLKRVRQVMDVLGEKPRADRCQAMAGLIEEAEEMAGKEADESVRDALLISMAQKVEHYEIAHYGTLCAWAEQIGLPDDALHPLQATLDEEKNADQKLQQLAAKINRMAVAT